VLTKRLCYEERTRERSRFLAQRQFERFPDEVPTQEQRMLNKNRQIPNYVARTHFKKLESEILDRSP